MVNDLRLECLCNPFVGRPWMKDRGAAAAAGGQKFFKGIVAGGLTGAIEACISYPTEFIKTQLQLDGKGGNKQYTGVMDVIKKTFEKHGVFGLYRGLSILIYGSVPKTGIRFGTFEVLKKLSQDESGRNTKTSTFLSGMGAGCAESVFAVTPMETIKVRMVNDRRLPEPRYKSMFHAVGLITKEEGFKGVYKGVVPTTIKQGSSMAIRFLVVETLKDWWREGDSSKPVPVYMIPIFGVIGGTTSVLINTPVDVVKTKMQGLDSHKYKGTIDCFKKVYEAEGMAGFYKGMMPRMLRVSLDVAVTFTLYDVIMDIFSKIWP